MLILVDVKNSFRSPYISSMLEMSNRMQLDSDDDLITAPGLSGSPGGCLGASVRSLDGILRVAAGAAIVILVACSPVDNGRHDWARELAPADSFSLQSTDWDIETWSASRMWTFASRMSPAEYQSWVERKLGKNWHRRVATGSGFAYVRLTATEQQLLEIGVEITPQALHVRVIFTAMPT